jgi:4-hydroxybenzoate polyprenyltransferase
LLTAVPVLGGAAVAVLSIRAVLAHPGDDAAWVRIVLGAALVAWGVAFVALGRHPDREPEPDADSDDDRGPRHMSVLASVVVATGAYAVLRSWEWGVLGALVGTAIATALPLLNRYLDRVIARREAEPGTQDAGA